MIGWMRPYTTTQPLTKPHAAPVPMHSSIPSAICQGGPFSTRLARQLTSVMTAPTDRSSPPSSTGSVCAIATIASANTSLAFWM